MFQRQQMQGAAAATTASDSPTPHAMPADAGSGSSCILGPTVARAPSSALGTIDQQSVQQLPLSVQGPDLDPWDTAAMTSAWLLAIETSVPAGFLMQLWDQQFGFHQVETNGWLPTSSLM